MKKAFIGLLLTLTLGTYTIKDFKEDRTNEIQEVKAQTIEEIEKYQKQKRTIPLSSEQQEELEKIKKEKEIAIEKEKTKKVNDEFSKDLDNIENKINNLDFNYENPFDKLSEDDQVRLTKENKDRLNNLIEKSKINKENLAKLQKEPSQKDNTDYQNSKLNEIRDNNNKKVEEKIRQENKRKQKASTSKKESKPESKPQTTSDNTVQQAKQPEKVNYSVTYNGEVYPIVHGYQDRVDARHKEWVNTMDSMNPEFDIPYKYVGDNRNIWLAAHTDAYDSSIKDAQVITYTDPDGNQKDYAFYGYLEDLPMGGETFYDDDPIVPWIEGTAGDYLVFQVCTDYSYGRGIAIGYVFAPVE